MTVYLLIVIIGLLINRKLGIFLLVVPVVGVILLLLLAWLSDNEVVRRAFAPVPVPATPSPSDNLTCAERLTPAACAGHPFLVTGFILLMIAFAWVVLDRHRVVLLIRRAVDRYRERFRRKVNAP